MGGSKSFDSTSTASANPGPMGRLGLSRPSSIRSTLSNLPRGARWYRASWTTHGFAKWDAISSLRQHPEGVGVRMSSHSAYRKPFTSTRLNSFVEEEVDAAILDNTTTIPMLVI